MKRGETIGKYQLVDKIGQGGMGEVWLATARGAGGFHKSVVLKTLRPELAKDPLFVDMLSHEARICARLSHPNLVEVFDFELHEGTYLLAMEHVTGHSLTEIMQLAQQREWPIPPWFAARVVWECCRGLAYAHDQGVIHCDLSASNVMVTAAGVTKILDFGVAHISAHGPKSDRLKGKFGYMAPERIRSLVTDRRTDIYSLGVLLYLMTTGRLPFTGDNDQQLMWRIVREMPRPPSVYCAIDPRIEQVILRAIQPDPAARQQSAGELLQALAACFGGQLATYGHDEVAAFAASLFGADSDTRRHQLPRAQLVEEPVAREIELDSFDIDIETSGVVIEQIPAAPAPSSTFMPAPRARTIVFGDPPARPAATHVFGERPTLAFRANVFSAPARAAEPAHADPDLPGIRWPWPSSRAK